MKRREGRKKETGSWKMTLPRGFEVDDDEWVTLKGHLNKCRLTSSEGAFC